MEAIAAAAFGAVLGDTVWRSLLFAFAVLTLSLRISGRRGLARDSVKSPTK